MTYKNAIRSGIFMVFSLVVPWYTPVVAEVNVGVDVVQSGDSMRAEQTHSTVTVDQSRVSSGKNAQVLVTLIGDGGRVLGVRMVTLRLYRDTFLIGTAQKATDEQGLVLFTVGSQSAQTARVEVYDSSNATPVKLIQEPLIIFDGGSTGSADIVVSSGVISVQPLWYQQIFTFLVGLFRLRF